MSCSDSDLHRAYEALKQEMFAHVTRGELDRALELSREAVDTAAELQDQVLMDNAFCNRAALLLARGQGEDEIPELRRILMRTPSSAVRFLASYSLCQYHDLQEEMDKCRFYSETALRYAKLDGNPAFQAKAYNRLANIDLLESYFDNALEGYGQALALSGDEDCLESAKILSNIGYCQAVLGGLDDAFRSLTRSVRMMRRADAGPWLHLPLLGLSYTYLELGRYERAARHARRALMSAESGGPYQRTHVKNALYLLGEAEKLCGRDATAFECFHHLQIRFYPDQPMVVDVLMATDIRKLINLMA